MFVPKSTTPDVPAVRGDFYLNNVVLKIEGSLENVPREMFRRSTVWATMFSLPVAPGVVPDGTDDAHPLVFEDVTKRAFNPFVKVAATSEILNTPLPDLTCTEYADVYDLAQKWDMEDMSAALVSKITILFDEDYAVRQLYLAVRLKNPSWIESSVQRIMTRDHSLGKDEIDLLSINTVTSLISLRELYRNDIVTQRLTINRAAYVPMPPNYRGYNSASPPVHAAIRAFITSVRFAIETNDLSQVIAYSCNLPALSKHPPNRLLPHVIWSDYNVEELRQIFRTWHSITYYCKLAGLEDCMNTAKVMMFWAFLTAFLCLLFIVP